MRYFILLFCFIGIGCAPYPTGSVLTEAEKTAIKAEVKATLHRQDAAWNRGDIDVFMADYIKSEALRFASEATVQRGWQATLERYKRRYPDVSAMGQLSFSDLEIEAITPADTLVFGRWQLVRADDRPNGLFTLHMRKIDNRWVIVSDHTSSAPTP